MFISIPNIVVANTIVAFDDDGPVDFGLALPIVIACKANPDYLWLYKKLLREREAIAHVNVDRTDDHIILGVFLELEYPEGIEFDLMERVRLAGMSRSIGASPGLVDRIILGNLADLPAKVLDPLLDSFHSTGHFIITVGSGEAPQVQVHFNWFVHCETYTTLPTRQFVSGLVKRIGIE